MGSTALERAIVLQDGEGSVATVALGERTVVFGRWPPPHTDIQIRDPLAAKRHFEIRWNAQSASHEISDLKATFPATLNDDVVRGEARTLALGDVVALGRWTLRYVTLEHPEAGERRVIERNAHIRRLAAVTDPAVVVGEFIEALNARDFGHLLLVVSPSARPAGGGTTCSREDVFVFLKRFFEVFTDCRFGLDETWRLGNATFARIHVTGTHVALTDQALAFGISHGTIDAVEWATWADIAEHVRAYPW